MVSENLLTYGRLQNLRNPSENRRSEKIVGEGEFFYREKTKGNEIREKGFRQNEPNGQNLRNGL